MHFQHGAATADRFPRSASLPAVIMAGACLNALIVHVMEAASAGSLTALTLGVSPFQLVAIAVAMRLSLEDDGAGWTPPFALTALTLALVLVPSSAASWLALAFYAGAIAGYTTGERRTGALLFLAIALAALWSSVILKWIALPATAAEAALAGQVISLLRPDIVQMANVVGVPGGHNLIVMTRCTSAGALPIAAISVVAVAHLLGGIDKSRAIRACLVLAVLYVVANTLRLAAMAWSADMYTIVHGPVGANIFDMIQIFAVLCLGTWASRE